MSFLWATLPGLLSGAAIGMAYYSSTVVRRRLTLTLRRELALGRLAQHLSMLLSQDQPAYEEVMRAWEHGVIEVFDELHNQRLWMERRHPPWRRLPEPGRAWPDFQPAPTLGERE